MGREFPGGKGASRWEESFLVVRELFSANELTSGKRASLWEKSFLEGRPRALPSGKRASQW